MGDLCAHAGQGHGKQDALPGPVDLEFLRRQAEDLLHAGLRHQAEYHVLLRLRQAEVVQDLGAGRAQAHAEVVKVQVVGAEQAHRLGPLVPVDDGDHQLQPGQLLPAAHASTSSSS